MPCKKTASAVLPPAWMILSANPYKARCCSASSRDGPNQDNRCRHPLPTVPFPPAMRLHLPSPALLDTLMSPSYAASNVPSRMAWNEPAAGRSLLAHRDDDPALDPVSWNVICGVQH